MSRRILHISDLHFGRDRADLLEPLIATANAMAPDLIAISGDFTQRARHRQFAQARAFLDRLEPPVLCVPGNHDTPLENLWVRLATPWARYRRYIDRDTEPERDDGVLSVVGVNTVNPYAWQRGRIGRHAVIRARRAFADEPEGRVKVVVLHHPLEHTPDVDKRLMTGARKALAGLSEAGTDIVLSGHLHNWRAGPFVEAEGVLLVQAGTGLSTRVRGEPNDINLLTVAPGQVTIERLVAREGETAFTHERRATYRKTDGVWRRS